MRIESVTAHAFGPLAGETLELAPGLTVVAGVNESAKSSWHAALYAALCGRGQGRRPTPADRRLVERYKPWNDAPWLLSALARAGRRTAARDLPGPRRCRPRRAGPQPRRPSWARTGRRTDVAAEILAAGTPDASRWLGLDRAAFAAVALVNQAEHRAVRDAADGLQQYLRRATETARGGGSAEPALTALDRFLAERLGATAPARCRWRRSACGWPGRRGSWRAGDTSSTSPTWRPPGNAGSAAGSDAARLRSGRS